MASKVIGFRLPEDLAEELEKASEERGMTVAEFMRSLVDETLYPSAEIEDNEDDEVTREEIEMIINAQKDLSDDVKELKRLIDRVGVKIAGYELDGILSPKMVETMREAETIMSNIDNLKHKVDTLSIKLESAQDAITTTNRYEESLGRSYTELRKEVSIIGMQLAAMNNLPTKDNQLESKIAHLSTDITSIKRDIKRQPTDDIRMMPYTDGTEHKFRVYKSKAGLVKPRRVVLDPILGDKYIDETEPLD